jgi:hypothetical protein
MHWKPPHVSRHAHHESRGDDITKRVRVEVSDFDGKLDSCAFQDWLTALEDYFEWFDLSPHRRVRFVKICHASLADSQFEILANSDGESAWHRAWRALSLERRAFF